MRPHRRPVQHGRALTKPSRPARSLPSARHNIAPDRGKAHRRASRPRSAPPLPEAPPPDRPAFVRRTSPDRMIELRHSRPRRGLAPFGTPDHGGLLATAPAAAGGWRGSADAAAPELIRPSGSRRSCTGGPSRTACYTTTKRPCCTGRRCGRTKPYPHPGSGEADVLRASEIQHAVQHAGCDRHLGLLTPVGTRAQPVANDALPSGHVSPDQGAPVVSGGTLLHGSTV